MSEESITFNLELNTSGVLSKLQQVEFIFYRAIGLWNRICRAVGVPDDSPFLTVTTQIQKITMLIRQLHTAAVLLDAASGPIGWAKAGIGYSAFLLSANDFMMDSGA